MYIYTKFDKLVRLRAVFIATNNNDECVANSGDQDSVIPLTGSRKLVHRLAKQLGLNTTVPYSVWFEGQQVNNYLD